MSSWPSMLYWLLVAAMLRMSCEMSIDPPPAPEQAYPVEGSVGFDTLPPQQREWARRAVDRYAEAQERKWHSWCDTMFRPKS